MIQPKTILFVFGTRPEFIKIKPIIDKYDGTYKVLFTGQHKDIAPKDVVDYELEIEEGPNRLDSVVTSCLNSDKIFEGVEYVLVQGDTSSVFGIALAAFHRNIKVIHLEAGLRTWDKQNPFPEEANRQMVSSIAEIHLCPTEANRQNLIDERVNGTIHVVGNTVLDSIDRDDCQYGDNVLVTLHRRENHHHIETFFKNIDAIAKKYPHLNFVLPLHPNPNVAKYKNIFEHVNVIAPLSRNDLITFLKTCKLVISDSGGIQEECSFLNKKVIVCRKITERNESIGTHSFLCPEPSGVSKIFDELINDFQVDEICPYGDGTATNKIIDILNSLN
jgi:UDP-N-acetylglucosamine 2-epimerase